MFTTSTSAFGLSIGVSPDRRAGAATTPAPPPIVEQKALPLSARLLQALLRRGGGTARELRAVEYLALRLVTRPEEGGLRRLLPEDEVDLLLAGAGCASTSAAGLKNVARFLALMEEALRCRTREELHSRQILERVRALKYELGRDFCSRDLLKAAGMALLLIEVLLDGMGLEPAVEDLLPVGGEPSRAIQTVGAGGGRQRLRLPLESVPASSGPPGRVSAASPLLQAPEEPIPLPPAPGPAAWPGPSSAAFAASALKPAIAALPPPLPEPGWDEEQSLAGDVCIPPLEPFLFQGSGSDLDPTALSCPEPMHLMTAEDSPPDETWMGSRSASDSSLNDLMGVLAETSIKSSDTASESPGLPSLFVESDADECHSMQSIVVIAGDRLPPVDLVTEEGITESVADTVSHTSEEILPGLSEFRPPPGLNPLRRAAGRRPARSVEDPPWERDPSVSSLAGPPSGGNQARGSGPIEDPAVEGKSPASTTEQPRATSGPGPRKSAAGVRGVSLGPPPWKNVFDKLGALRPGAERSGSRPVSIRGGDGKRAVPGRRKDGATSRHGAKQVTSKEAASGEAAAEGGGGRRLESVRRREVPASRAPSALQQEVMRRKRGRLLLLLGSLGLAYALGLLVTLSLAPQPEFSQDNHVYVAYDLDRSLQEVGLVSARRYHERLILNADGRYLRLPRLQQERLQAHLARYLMGRDGIEGVLLLDLDGRQLRLLTRADLDLAASPNPLARGARPPLPAER